MESTPKASFGFELYCRLCGMQNKTLKGEGETGIASFTWLVIRVVTKI